jgi:ketosteroid isomerase-like protein
VSASRTPRETVELLLHTMVHGRRAEVADLYAPDVIIDNPWAPEGLPRLAEGRKGIRSRMQDTEKLWNFDSVRDVVIHETVDPEIIVSEYRLDASITQSGAKFSLGFVSVLRIVDGLIVSARDYSNPVETGEIAKLFDFGS